ncbi:MAG: twin-arginine translocase TatA/TatE family subunit [Clostridia bacterium]|nr:twin-arginine translocase TatA/TatE family subunit [Clostridia bacterium]
MFNIGATELILILLIAFVVVGPKDLPKIARAIGRFIKYARNLIKEISKETGFSEIADELRGVEKDVKETIRSVDIREDLKQTKADIDKEIKDAAKEVDVRGIEKEINS